jgi:hypothetical protein
MCHVRSVMVAALLVAPMTTGRAQAGSLVSTMMTQGTNALNDLKYPLADSIASRILAYGPSLLTQQQQLDALQLRIAALYPEDPPYQKQDKAIDLIKEMLKLGSKKVPRDLSWSGLDALVVMVTASTQPGQLYLGSKTPGAVVFVDSASQGPVQSLRWVSVPPGVPVKISITAENCKQAWDSTVVVRPADSTRVGFRNPKCSQ